MLKFGKIEIIRPYYKKGRSKTLWAQFVVCPAIIDNNLLISIEIDQEKSCNLDKNRFSIEIDNDWFIYCHRLLLIIIGKNLSHSLAVQQKMAAIWRTSMPVYLHAPHQLDVQSERDCKERNTRCSWWHWIEWKCKNLLKLCQRNKKWNTMKTGYAWSSCWSQK